jgi:peptide/nickel transport system permease protein
MSTLDQPHSTVAPVSSETTQEKPEEVQDVAPAFEAQGVWRLAFNVFVQNRLAVVGVGIVVFMVLFCFVGPFIYHTNQVDTNLANDFLAPSPKHWLGTDDDGFDIIGRLMIGGQTSLEIGIAAALIATLFGVMWGAVAGFFGGWVDNLLMRFVDIMLAIPALFLLLFLAVAFPRNVLTLILVVSVTAWLIPARLVRAEALTLRTRDYVQAVTMMGGGGFRIVLRHIIPNSVGTIMVNATFQVADAILLLAALGFLGLGLPAPQTDWGAMLTDGVTYALDGYWWLIYPAGFCIVIVVVAFNFVGDALRDSLEVRLQQR